MTINGVAVIHNVIQPIVNEDMSRRMGSDHELSMTRMKGKVKEERESRSKFNVEKSEHKHRKEGSKEGTNLFYLTEINIIQILHREKNLSGDSHLGTACAAIAGATHVSQYFNKVCNKMILQLTPRSWEKWRAIRSTTMTREV